MSIITAGGAYCPLSPRDPKQRLRTLVDQTHSRLVLVHWMTRDNFESDIPVLDIDAVIKSNKVLTDGELDRLSGVTVTADSIAYVVFTSGSTGISKAVSRAHYFFNQRP